MTNRSIIQVRGLTVFHGLRPVLRGINFEINQGEFAFLTGQTGSGKTSLLKILYADLPLRVGEVRIAGFELGMLKRADIPLLRRKLGIVFQDFQLLMDRNVEENLFFVLKATGWKNSPLMRKKVVEVLMRVGLDWAGKKMAHQLSGGEQQRLAIARALLNDPLVLLADEPTGNLDPSVAHGILSLFLEINQGGTAVLMATHNYDLLEKHPARVLQCHQGVLTDTQETTVAPQ
ncbi:MAG: ATP-binding cassette domain-containing protein [Bacteroidota bacterium]